MANEASQLIKVFSSLTERFGHTVDQLPLLLLSTLRRWYCLIQRKIPPPRTLVAPVRTNHRGYEIGSVAHLPVDAHTSLICCTEPASPTRSPTRSSCRIRWLDCAFEQMGYQAESATWRNSYLTAAMELRKGPPIKGVKRSDLIELMKQTPTERFLEDMAASLDGPAADGKDWTFNLMLTDTHESFVLWIENAVLHYRKGPTAANANATLTVTKDLFVRAQAHRVLEVGDGGLVIARQGAQHAAEIPGWRQIGIEQSGPVKVVGLRPPKNRYRLFLRVPINVIVLCRQTLRRWFRSIENTHSKGAEIERQPRIRADYKWENSQRACTHRIQIRLRRRNNHRPATTHELSTRGHLFCIFPCLVQRID